MSSSCKQIWHSKTGEHGHECSHFYLVCDAMNVSCTCGIHACYITNPFLLFAGQEQTNMAVPWAQIQNKKVQLLHEYWWNHHMKPANICTFFLRFWDNLQLCTRSLLMINPVTVNIGITYSHGFHHPVCIHLNPLAHLLEQSWEKTRNNYNCVYKHGRQFNCDPQKNTC